MRASCLFLSLALFLPAFHTADGDRTGVRCVFEPAQKVAVRKNSPAVLLLAGYGGEPEQYAKAAHTLAEAGYVSLRCGFTLSKLARERSPAEDLSVVQHLYDALSTTSGIDTKNIGVYATSLGAYLMPALASTRKVAWIALHAPALYPDTAWSIPVRETIEGDYNALQAWRHDPEKAKNNQVLALYRTFQGPTILFQSDTDEAIPPQTYLNWKKTHPQDPVVQIARAEHVLSEQQMTHVIRVLSNWLHNRRKSDSTN